MTQSVCIFNHKGGVSKTTTSYSLGWMLTEKGKRVILVDADSQCNLTNLVLGEDRFEQFYLDHPEQNLKSALSPAFDAKPAMLEAINCLQVHDNENLHILPGSFELSEYEVSLGVSFTLSDTMITLKNLPGSFDFLISRTAKKYDADFVIVDMNPSLSAINQALLVSCNYFIVPTAPDNFSTMAITSLSQILPKWEKWAERARKTFADASYPLPKRTPKFLGTVIQRFNIRKGKPTQASREVINKLCETVKTSFVEKLGEAGMMLPQDNYEADDFCLALIPDFQTLNPAYQTYGVPVFALSDDQLKYVGKVLEQYQKMRQNFHDIYSDFADRLIKMTNSE
ncbi:MAG: AAA family ATPase [Desulfobacteraceae bacterium]|nr:AAA family ATPase [Desulfobacteraceae bacterium]